MWSILVAALTALGAALAPPPTPSAADLPRGDPPAVGYVADGVWHDPSGRRVQLPDRHGISAVTAYDGGFLVADARFFEGSVGLARVDCAGRTVESWTSSGSPAVAADGRVGWTSFTPPETGLTRPSLVHVGELEVSWPEGRHGFFSTAGFVGEDVVVNDPRGVHLLAPDGESSRVRGVRFADDVTDRWLAGPAGRRSTLVDLRTGRVRWRTAGHGLTFSPSGLRVAALARDHVVVRRAADGRVLWEQPFHGYVGDLTWESEDAVLGVLVRRERATVVRFTRDGVERATRVAAYDVNRPSLVLGAD